MTLTRKSNIIMGTRGLKRKPRRKLWTDDLVVYEILRLYNTNVDLSPIHMMKIYPTFFGSVTHKRSWKAWIELARLNYKEIRRIGGLTEEEKLKLFLDFLAMIAEKKKVSIKNLAETYSISLRTVRRHILETSRKYFENGNEFYRKMLHYMRLTEAEKMSFFFDYLAMNFEKKNAPGKGLAEKYSIGYSTARNHIHQMLKKYSENRVKLSDDFKKRFYDYIVEETKRRGGLNTVSDLERKILSNCGYEIVKEDTTTFLRRK